VIASMWPVADIVGPRLMETLYGGVIEGKPPVAALSEAMRARRSRNEDPVYWGAFQVSSVAGARTLH
jgi:CHAT domain-containing protein